MGTEALRNAVEAEARAKIERVLEEAHGEARARREESHTNHAARRDRALQQEGLALRRSAAARLAAARHVAQRRVLEAREELLDSVFALARDQLGGVLGSREAAAWIEGLAEQALRQLPPGPVVIRCSSEVVATLEHSLADRDDVRVERAPELRAGFRAEACERAVCVDAVLPDLLALHRPVLSIELLGRLERREGA